MCVQRKENTKEYFFSLTYKELEAITNVSFASWGRWFTGGRSPALNHLEELAIALDMPLLEFVDAFKERRDKTMAMSEQKKVAA